MSKSTTRELAAAWGMKRNVHLALTAASPATLAQFQAFNLPAWRSLSRYHADVIRDCQQSFWIDAAQDGLAYALEHWAWLVQ